MSSSSSILRRELRVAFSRHAQPVWFRVLKWTLLIAGAVRYHDQPWFWGCVAGIALAGCLLHLLYRWKTRVWSRPWGGWNDLAAVQDR